MKIEFIHKLVAFILILILPVFVMKRYTLLKHSSRARFDSSATLIHNELQEDEKKINIIAIGNKNLNEKTIKSLLDQEYKNYLAVCFSFDEHDNEHLDAIATSVDDRKQLQFHYCEDQFDLIRKFHRYVMGLEEDEIVVLLGEKNYFLNGNILARINSIHKAENIYASFGQFIYENSDEIGFHIPSSIKKEWNIKHTQKLFWLKSSFKTFYAGLYQQLNIDEQDLRKFTTFEDFILFHMKPIAELSKKNIRFISDILYVHCN